MITAMSGYLVMFRLKVKMWEVQGLIVTGLIVTGLIETGLVETGLVEKGQLK
jgi:hypothetical protein